MDEPHAPAGSAVSRSPSGAMAALRSRAMPARARPDLPPLLASHGPTSLASYLEAAGGSASAARSAAGRAITHAFGAGATGAEAVPWDRATLARLQIGAWAHASLLALVVRPSLTIESVAPADDGTERLLLRARDGELLETVIIPVTSQTGAARVTVCISSQVGCARACTFCETGAHGLSRQLDAGEIVDQVRIARARRAERGESPVTNVVFMGMGEPFDNLGEVSRAAELLTDGRAFRLAPSRVTVSTVGVADKIEAFFASCAVGLAVSLNAPDDARRSAIMPINQRFSMGVLREALVRHLPASRHVLFEYVLIAGFNDAVADADLVADYVAGIACRVNVIPLNPGPNPAQKPPSVEVLDAFVERLSERGVVALVRRPRGRDVGGACGQLAGAARREKPSLSESDTGGVPRKGAPEAAEPVASPRPDE